MSVSINGPKILFDLPFGGIHITETIVNMWIVMAIIIAFRLWITKDMRDPSKADEVLHNPSKRQAAAEKLVLMAQGLVDSNMGKKMALVYPVHRNADFLQLCVEFSQHHYFARADGGFLGDARHGTRHICFDTVLQLQIKGSRRLFQTLYRAYRRNDSDESHFGSRDACFHVFASLRQYCVRHCYHQLDLPGSPGSVKLRAGLDTEPVYRVDTDFPGGSACGIVIVL